MRTSVRTILKGTRYYDAEKSYNSGFLRVGEVISLKHNSRNSHDKYAVEAYLASSGAMLGHISKDYSKKYSELLAQGAVLSSKVSEVSCAGNEIRVEIEIKYDGGATNPLHSSKIWRFSENLPVSPGVYQLKNDSTKEIYIGSSNNVKLRIRDHIKALESGSHVNKFLQDSYKKNGPNCFSATLLVECASEQLLLVEEKEIKKAMAAGLNLLNMTDTGQGVKPRYGAASSENISARGARTVGNKSDSLSLDASLNKAPLAKVDGGNLYPAIIGWIIFIFFIYSVFF